MKKIFDISKIINDKMVVYPGDPPFKLDFVEKIEDNGYNLSVFTMSSHTGTHLDTPNHVSNDLEGIEKVDLKKCYGQCKVFDLTHIGFGNNITRNDLEKENIDPKDIILLKTKNSFIKSSNFREDHIKISIDAAKYLIKRKIRTLGFDYLTIGDINVHRLILKNRILIFENLDMSKIQAGRFTFIGLPIKIKAEGAPARVILIEE